MANEWSDVRLGTNGRGAWIAPAGLIAVCYQLFKFVGASLGQESVRMIWPIDGPLILIFLVLFIGCIQFIVTSRKTLQRINVDGEMCTVWQYYGKNIVFQRTQIIYVEPFRLSILQKLMTPLHREQENYRVAIDGGMYFYISAATPNVESLIDLLSAKAR